MWRALLLTEATIIKTRSIVSILCCYRIPSNLLSSTPVARTTTTREKSRRAIMVKVMAPNTQETTLTIGPWVAELSISGVVDILSIVMVVGKDPHLAKDSSSTFIRGGHSNSPFNAHHTFNNSCIEGSVSQQIPLERWYITVVQSVQGLSLGIQILPRFQVQVRFWHAIPRSFSVQPLTRTGSYTDVLA